MTVPRHLIIATDLSPTAANAAQRGFALAQTLSARVTLLHLVEPLPVVSGWADPMAASWVDVSALENAGQRALSRWAEALPNGMGAQATQVARIGLPRSDLGNIAKSLDGDLLVLGLRADRDWRDRLLGNTAQAALHDCPLPLLLVRRPAAAPWQRLLAITDFSDSARRAREVAMSLAPWSEQRLLHVEPSLPEATLALTEPDAAMLEAYRRAHADQAAKNLSEESARLPEGWVTSFRHGYAIDTILGEAEQHASDLIALGTRGHGPWVGRLIGSIGQGVVARATSDLLLAAA